MRNILFKAKRVDNGKWAYGYYEFYNGGHYINVQTDDEIKKKYTESEGKG